MRDRDRVSLNLNRGIDDALKDPPGVVGLLCIRYVTETTKVARAHFFFFHLSKFCIFTETRKIHMYIMCHNDDYRGQCGPSRCTLTHTKTHPRKYIRWRLG